MSELQTGSDERKASLTLWGAFFPAAVLHRFSLCWETQLQEERKPPKAVESPKQSNHYQPVFFLLNLSHYGRHSICQLCSAYTQSRARRGAGYFLFMCVCVCPWCVKSHNLIKFSVEGNTGSKCNFCPILIKANLIFFPFCELKSLPTLFHLGSVSTGRNPKTQAGCKNNRLAFINV